LESEREGKQGIKESTGNFRDKFLSFLGTGYYALLYRFLSSRSSRLLSIFIPFLLLVLSFVFLSPKIGFTLFPASDEGVITMNIQGQTGSNKESLE